jgi:hypothetical protein
MNLMVVEQSRYRLNSALVDNKRLMREGVLIARLDDDEASDELGRLEEAATGVLAALVDALEAPLDVGDALLSHFVDGSGVRLGEVALPILNTLGNPVPEEWGQVG